MSLFNNLGMDCTMPVQSGLFRFARVNNWSTPIPAPVPLQSVNVAVKLVHVMAQVEVTQTFVNKESQPIEAIYKFPIDSNGALTHFHAEIEDQKIQGLLKENKTEAKKVYNETIAGQNSAVLGELEQSDVVQISIGWLKPGSQAKIVIKFLTEVKNVKGSQALRFFLPTTIAPRYAPARFLQDNASQEMATMVYREWTNVTFHVPMSIKMDVQMPWDMDSIVCPDYPVTVTQKGSILDNKWYSATIELSAYKVKEMEKDFVVLIQPKKANDKPKLYLEKLNSKFCSAAIMAHIVPSFKLAEQFDVELIFVVDQSASMNGESIRLAKNALTLLLRSMPPNCYFNVVGFGASHRKQFTRSSKCDVYNFQEALYSVQNMAANMYGTEMLPALKEIYGSSQIPAHHRQIFVITDGNVANADEVIGLTGAMTSSILGANGESLQSTRIFTIGVGQSVSHHLVQRLAEAGQGTSIFIGCGDDDDWENKVLAQLEDALQPSLKDVKIEWRNGTKKFVDAAAMTPLKTTTMIKDPEQNPVANESLGENIETKRTLLGYGKPIISENEETFENPSKKRKIHQLLLEKFPPIFDGSQFLVFGIFPQTDSDSGSGSSSQSSADSEKNFELPTGLTITAQSTDGPLSLELELAEAMDFGKIVGDSGDQNGDGILHKMAAIKLIKELEQKLAAMAFQPRPNFREEQALKKQICDIALDEGILTRHTALVCVAGDDSSTKSTHVENDKSAKFEQPMPRRLMQATSSRTSWNNRGPIFNYWPSTWTTSASSTVGGFTFGTAGPVSTSSGGGSLFGTTASSNSASTSTTTEFSFSAHPQQPTNFGNTPTTSLFGGPAIPNPTSRTTPSSLFSVGSFGSSGPLFGSSAPSNSAPFGGFGSSSSTSDFVPPASSVAATFKFSAPSSTNPNIQTFGFSTSATPAAAAATGSTTTTEAEGFKFPAAPFPPSPFSFKIPALDPSKIPGLSTTSNEMERLKKIVSCQSDNGSFSLTANFCEAIGLDFERVKDAKGQETWSDEAWATALALSFFDEKMPHQKFFYESSATKAQEWLDRTSGVVTLKPLMDTAKSFIQERCK